LDGEVARQVEISIKYEGYIERQQAEVEKFKNLENKEIPMAFDYSAVPSLRLEARQKLGKIRPATIGQAGRISGVSPADISILMVCLKRQTISGTTRDSVPSTCPNCSKTGA
jgi:tRNA uridine 5-carboxymethylaminomethyl modification enzyme